jgi:hypothetical protein
MYMYFHTEVRLCLEKVKFILVALVRLTMRVRSIIERLSSVFNQKRDQRGLVVSREVCVGDVTEDAVWFEVCDAEADDFRLQYGIPKQDYSYTDAEMERLAEFSADDRTVYTLTVESVNKKGTRWLFRSIEAIGTLSDGYQKNILSP